VGVVVLALLLLLRLVLPKSQREGHSHAHAHQLFLPPSSLQLTSSAAMNAATRARDSRDAPGAASKKSARSCASQCSALANVSAANMAAKPALNSSRKMVSARHVSITALLSFSLTRSSSISRRLPRKIFLFLFLFGCFGGLRGWWLLEGGGGGG
jgi:hypothetical protein